MASIDEERDDETGQWSWSRWALLALPAVLVAAGGIWWALSLLQPPPQRTVVITTGAETGAYHMFARRYQAALQRSGIRTELRPSAGSIENLARLNDAKTKVTVALLQGGIGNDKTAPGVASLGGMFLEPVWIFYRSTDTLDRLGQLKGRRIAVGPDGSGTRALAEVLLGASQITPANATFSVLTGPPAREALVAGAIDVMFGVAAAETPWVQEMLRNPEVRLMSMAQAEALTRLFPYLTRVTLPQGVIELDRNLPTADVVLVAAIASLVVRDELHPALVAQLTQAAAEAHSGAGIFQRAGQFPIASDGSFPMSPDAQRFYKSGPPFLQRYLPFWLANFVERMIVLLVPALTIAVPLFKGGPALYRYRIRQRLHLWYGRLKKLEGGIIANPTAAALARQRGELNRIDEAVSRIKVPKAFAEQFYNLRTHVDFVRRQLESRAAAQG